MRNRLWGECLSEYLGTFILIFVGCGTVAGLVLNGVNLGQWELSLVWGLAVTMAIYVTGAVSGTHINPAVTITLAVFRGFPWRKVGPYIMAQVAGAFTGAAVTYALYNKAFAQFESAENITRGSAESVATAGIFSTYPAPFLTNMDAFFVEFAITALLLIVILAVVDDRNPLFVPLKNMGPLIIGLTVAMIGGSWGNLTGFALNPARDFGPKLFAWAAGWESIALPAPAGYFWVPLIAPVLGGLFGALVYDQLVRRYLHKEEEVPTGKAQG
ncbi:MIP/aquaporin family protein [Desmospora profundinema]|uniref:Glycerol uptake facilitator protein n=1 Tax=Desmospora profundinema TaxID=1571184 RepID=A0ABU1IQZ8_9BACL|nr:MIP/aquaporin family protein [Desmospora profundinema]MDR6227217.1 glycerol uptake facilitator protein [Desmospora profundinema]